MSDHNPLRATIFVGRLRNSQAVTLTPSDDVWFTMDETEDGVDAEGFPITIHRRKQFPYSTQTLADLQKLATERQWDTRDVKQAKARVRELLKGGVPRE